MPEPGLPRMLSSPAVAMYMEAPMRDNYSLLVRLNSPSRQFELKLPDPQADLQPIEPFLPVLFGHIFSVFFLILLFCTQKCA